MNKLLNGIKWWLNLFKLDRKRQSELDDYANEYLILSDLVKEIGSDSSRGGEVVDIAASDGFSQSSTLGFYRNGHSGLAVEMDSNKFAKLALLYRDFHNVRLIKARVTPANVVSLLEAAEIQINEFLVLNLDIDSYDLEVMETILKSAYLPTIISMEVNEKIPVGIYFTVRFDEKHYWQGDHFYGCSLDAAVSTVCPYGYVLYGLEYNNAIFVKESFASTSWPKLSVEDAYCNGYKNRKHRKQLFPWNEDVEYWQELKGNELIGEINKKFSAYKGKYKISLSNKWSEFDT